MYLVRAMRLHDLPTSATFGKRDRFIPLGVGAAKRVLDDGKTQGGLSTLIMKNLYNFYDYADHNGGALEHVERNPE